MAEELITGDATDTQDVAAARVYEVGYHVIPTVPEENIEKIVGDIRSAIEQAGGAFIAEGAPVLMKLSYPMISREGDKNVEHDRGYFGWIKFESSVVAAQALEESLKTNTSILRHIVFRTVREETRARMKAPTLREVKRTDTLKTSPRREEDATAAPVSEVDLDKALNEITSE